MNPGSKHLSLCRFLLHHEVITLPKHQRQCITSRVWCIESPLRLSKRHSWRRQQNNFTSHHSPSTGSHLQTLHQSEYTQSSITRMLSSKRIKNYELNHALTTWNQSLPPSCCIPTLRILRRLGQRQCGQYTCILATVRNIPVESLRHSLHIIWLIFPRCEQCFLTFFL